MLRCVIIHAYISPERVFCSLFLRNCLIVETFSSPLPGVGELIMDAQHTELLL